MAFVDDGYRDFPLPSEYMEEEETMPPAQKNFVFPTIFENEEAHRQFHLNSYKMCMVIGMSQTQFKKLYEHYGPSIMDFIHTPDPDEKHIKVEAVRTLKANFFKEKPYEPKPRIKPNANGDMPYCPNGVEMPGVVLY